MARIYLASSWRNELQPHYVKALRAHGHQVYDFKMPEDGIGFSWNQTDHTGTAKPTFNEYMKMLAHPAAAAGYLRDFRAMQWADTCVLLLPCGRSAHLEAGWFAGANKRLIIVTKDGEEPELMALMANHIVNDLAPLLTVL
jgi:hypothetical protein